MTVRVIPAVSDHAIICTRLLVLGTYAKLQSLGSVSVEGIKLLALGWDKAEDALMFSCSKENTELTKRGILG